MVYVILGTGFEEIEALAVVDILRRGGVEVKTAGIGNDMITGGHGICVKTDMPVSDIDIKKKDYVVIPGGLGGVESCEKSEEVSALLLSASAVGATLCAICAGPRVLSRLGLLSGRHVTCYPGVEDELHNCFADTSASVVVDGDRISGRAPGSALDFGIEILRTIKGDKVADKVAKGMHYPGQK